MALQQQDLWSLEFFAFLQSSCVPASGRRAGIWLSTWWLNAADMAYGGPENLAMRIQFLDPEIFKYR